MRIETPRDGYLKCCPFCGSRAVFTKGANGYQVECSQRIKGCPVDVKTFYCHNLIDAELKWNTRK